MTSRRFARLFGGPARRPESPLTQREMDLAASIQQVTEEIMLRIARHVHGQTGMKNLCLAGGVALNCVGNGRILREGPFEQIWIQPAAGDAGGALGVALLIWHQLLGNARQICPGDAQKASLLGPRFSGDEIRAFLETQGAKYRRFEDESALCDYVSELLVSEKVVGWMQGRMEFGPRALGNRSILGDARSRQMQKVMNLKIKFRESFRPFAPVVLRDRVGEYFQMAPGQDSPYMLLVAPVADERRIAHNGQSAIGLDKLKHRSGNHACRLFGPCADGGCRPSRAVLQADEGLRGEDWLSGHDQHQLQRPRRADRLLSRTRLPLLHGHEHGRAGHGGLRPVERRAAGSPGI